MKKIDYKKIATDIRKKILQMKLDSGGSHIGSAFSCVDILTVLYFKTLNINPKKPFDKNRDRFILSKGHAASALYAILAKKGFTLEKVLDNYCRNGSLMSGHSMKGSMPGVEVSTGSLGHGLPIAIGMATAAKRENKNYRVFVMLSDGECDEGSVWEAALFASHHKLDNLTAIVDYNKIQSFGRTNEVLNLEPLAQKWQSFGWQAKEINGHSFKEIEKSFEILPFKKNCPSVIIAHTVKGSGGQTACDIFENKLEWHYKSPNKEIYENAIRLLDKEKM